MGLPASWGEALHAAADAFFPRRCLHCDTPVDAQLCLCDACRTAIAGNPLPICPHCASTIGPNTDASDGCPRCRTHTFHFASAQRLGSYDGVLRDCVLGMKHRRGETLAEAMGEFWAMTCREELLRSDPQAIVAVPLHWRRHLARGFNQAAALGRSLAVGLGLPYLRSILWRVKATPKLAGMNRNERRQTMADAFRARRVESLRILLVDDVLTTGATADAAATALRRAGAAQVDVAVLSHR